MYKAEQQHNSSTTVSLVWYDNINICGKESEGGVHISQEFKNNGDMKSIWEQCQTISLLY